jgi:nitric oxide reductase NorQ protein
MNAQLDSSLYAVNIEPYYEPVSNEVDLFEAAYSTRVPVLLKGPTGCGKTRFMEYMAWKLKRPLITVSCHDDLTASDLVGRYLVKGGETTWVDGPLARSVRMGAICYLDEIVEARKDTMVVIHPLADDRRVLKELKQSTRQRFIAIAFNYPRPELERKVIIKETGVDGSVADKLIKLAEMTRNLKGNGLEEGASTRLLVHAGKLIEQGVEPRAACQGAISQALTDDSDMVHAVNELIAAMF